MNQKNDIAVKLVSEAGFSSQIQGKEAKLYTLRNGNGMVAQISNYGARLVSLFCPDRNNNFTDIVTGFEKASDYVTANESYFGATVGRYANRIANASFSLDGQVFHLEPNNGPNSLHGGSRGFNSVVWNEEEVDAQHIKMSYLSPHLDQNFPGNLQVYVTYTLTDDNELRIDYQATTDKTTVVNLTHHSFFNLKGAGAGDIYDHILQINADSYTEVDEFLIPKSVKPVAGTPMDFRNSQTMGLRMDDAFQQLEYGNGYDHNWILNKNPKGLNYAARVVEPTSLRVLEVYTNEPGLQFYGGNWLSGNDVGKNMKTYNRRSSFCLETQHYPDSPNHQSFPSVVLKPGELYRSVCNYKFSVHQ